MIRHPIVLTALGALFGHAYGIWSFLNSGLGQFAMFVARGNGHSDLSVFARFYVMAVAEPNLAIYDPRVPIALGAAVGLIAGLILRSQSQRQREPPTEPGAEAPSGGLHSATSKLVVDEGPDLGELADLALADTDDLMPAPPRRPTDAPLPVGPVVAFGGLVVVLGGLFFYSMSGKREVQPEESTEAPAVHVSSIEGEWFNAYDGGRSLSLHGTLSNRTEDFLEEVRCDVELRLRLAARSERVRLEGQFCGFPTNLDRFGYKSVRSPWGIKVERKWLDYGVEAVQVRLRVTAKTPFGETLEGRTPWYSAEPPSTRVRFALTGVAESSNAEQVE